ncbi:hypothetical protein ACLB2K_039035 [Fragaria x ananassa]
MGMLDNLSDYFTISSKPKKKRKALQTVEIKVKMDCDGCERRVKSAVSNMKGAKQVEVNRKQSRVTVTGYVEAKKVLKKVKSTGKRAEIWPYVPYNLVAYPYVAGVYDKKAPSGYVRNVPQAFALAPDDQYTSMFSDDNPHACAIILFHNELQTQKETKGNAVEIKVKMDCDGCERRVKSAVSNMKGARQVEVNRKQSRVTVTGYVEPNKVLKKVKSTGKKAEIWPYVPYNLVAYPYVAGAYDKKAPSGYVRNVAQAVSSAPDDQYTSMFSDENPHACAIM